MSPRGDAMNVAQMAIGAVSRVGSVRPVWKIAPSALPLPCAICVKMGSILLALPVLTRHLFSMAHCPTCQDLPATSPRSPQ